MSSQDDPAGHRRGVEVELMAKTKNDPKKYVKRDVIAPQGRHGLLPDALKLDLTSQFFTAPVQGKYLDWRDAPKSVKSR